MRNQNIIQIEKLLLEHYRDATTKFIALLDEDLKKKLTCTNQTQLNIKACREYLEKPKKESSELLNPLQSSFEATLLAYDEYTEFKIVRPLLEDLPVSLINHFVDTVNKKRQEIIPSQNSVKQSIEEVFISTKYLRQYCHIREYTLREMNQARNSHVRAMLSKEKSSSGVSPKGLPESNATKLAQAQGPRIGSLLQTFLHDYSTLDKEADAIGPELLHSKQSDDPFFHLLLRPAMLGLDHKTTDLDVNYINKKTKKLACLMKFKTNKHPFLSIYRKTYILYQLYQDLQAFPQVMRAAIIEAIEDKRVHETKDATVQCLSAIFGTIEQFQALAELYRASQEPIEIIKPWREQNNANNCPDLALTPNQQKADKIQCNLKKDIRKVTFPYVKKLISNYQSGRTSDESVHLNHRRQCRDLCYFADNKLALIGDPKLRLKNIAASLLAAVSVVGLPFAVAHWCGRFNFFDRSKVDKGTQVSALKTPFRQLAQSSPAVLISCDDKPQSPIKSPEWRCNRL